MLVDPCADPGIFARGGQARMPENSSDNFFFSFLSSTFTVLQWLINGVFFFKENYNFTRFRGRGVSNIFQEGPTFSREVKLFPGDGGSKC